MTSRRAYRLRARADRQKETRQRIVAATQALHREVGPARTTIAEIARIAGVERLTVYNHFPEQIQLLAACQADFLGSHPPPELAPGSIARKDALRRLEEALTDLYAWFRTHEELEEKIFRDRHFLPDLDQLLSRNADPVFDSAAAAYGSLIGRTPQAAASVRRLARLGFDFWTWRSLTRDGLTDGAAARLLTRVIGAAA